MMRSRLDSPLGTLCFSGLFLLGVMAALYAVSAFFFLEIRAPLADSFAQAGWVERAQLGALLLTGVFFLLGGFFCPRWRRLSHLLAVPAWLALIRENDESFDLLFHGAWKVPFIIILFFGALYAWRHREEAAASFAEFVRLPCWGVLAGGFGVTFVFSRVFGMKGNWEAILAKSGTREMLAPEAYASLVRMVRRAAEEGTELFGYALIALAALSFAAACRQTLFPEMPQKNPVTNFWRGEAFKASCFAVLRLFFIVAVLGVSALFFFLDARFSAQPFPENAWVEQSQLAVLFLTAFLFLIGGFMCPAYRRLSHLLTLPALVGLIRRFSTPGAWRMVFLFAFLCALFYAWRYRKEIIPALNSFFRQPCWGMLAAGFGVTVMCARIFGQADLWEALLAKFPLPLDVPSPLSHTLSRAAEEGAELCGYALITLAAFSFVLFCRRKA